MAKRCTIWKVRAQKHSRKKIMLKILSKNEWLKSAFKMVCFKVAYA